MVLYYNDAYGNIESQMYDSTTDKIGELNPFRYKGYYYDEELDMYYCQTRYYVPSWRRWLNYDNPSFLEFDNINGMNLFAYCCNNPVMFLDSSGCSPLSIFGDLLNGFFKGMTRALKYSLKYLPELTIKQAQKMNKTYKWGLSAREVIRRRSANIASTKSTIKGLSKAVTIVGRTLVGIDIGISLINNFNSGSDTWVTDSIVDTGYALFQVGVGTLAFSAVSWIPFAGPVLGVAASIVATEIADYIIGDKVLDDIKDWAKDVGDNITDGWNSFWSFDWIG